MRFLEKESSVLELKSDIPLNNQIIKTAIAFCNTHGGKIVIGVKNDGYIIGLSDIAIQEAIERLETAIFDACIPHIIPKLYAQYIGEVTVLVIEIIEGMNKPYYLRADGIDKGTYIRLGCHTIHATPEIIQELKWSACGIDFEKTAVLKAHIDDLSPVLIEQFIKNRKKSSVVPTDDQLLRSYHLISYDQSKKYPSVAGVLLFCTNPQAYFSEAMIICTQFKGNAGREVIATVDCIGTLFNQFNQAFDFIISRLYKSFIISGKKREETLEIPEIAIREALLNIIVHRNYYLTSPAKIAIYDDRIEFFSPGGFKGPFIPEKILSGITYLRNPAICKVLREAQYIEKLGSGIIEIFSSFEQHGLNLPSIIDGGDYVKCILPRSKKEVTNVDDQFKLLELLKIHKELSITDLENKLKSSRSTILRKINIMLRAGLIERIGQKRGIRYRLMQL